MAAWAICAQCEVRQCFRGGVVSSLAKSFAERGVAHGVLSLNESKIMVGSEEPDRESCGVSCRRRVPGEQYSAKRFVRGLEAGLTPYRHGQKGDGRRP